MGIGSVGGGNAQAIAALQRQSRPDQKQLADDQKADAGQKVIAVDGAKIIMTRPR